MSKKKPPAKAALPAKRKQIPTARLDVVELFAKSAQCAEAGRIDEARTLYRDWLLGNTNHPMLYAVLFNLGCTVMGAGDNAAAEQAFREALRRKPDFWQAAFNQGTALERLGRFEEALAAWKPLIALPDDCTGETRVMLLLGLNHSGRVLEGRKRFNEAEAFLERSLRLDPDQPKVIHHWVHLRQKQCAWPVFSALPGLDGERMQGCTSALAMLDVTDDPAVQLSAARRFAQEYIPEEFPPLAQPGGYGHGKLRVGYLSSDFCLHPVSILMVELFERHDRSRVEVHGYCWSREDGSELRRRVITALDHHVSIAGMTDEAAAQRIRADEIDVLVDLHGPTAGARPGILARRPAVAQVSYLGFPGTSGMPCIDSILCDRYVLNEGNLAHMTERPLFLPEVFQVCDSRRAVNPAPTRKDCGLPEKGFVFCAFNNSHKYTPRMFEAWTNILRRVPDSVLWLVADNASVAPNLLRFCAERNIPAKRLIFAPRVAPPDYLARYQVADLFLDCFPFNGGTTANDALWMGLPLLTLSGRAMASRMAGSLLCCLGLPELIATDFGQYEDMAVALANDPERLAGMRRHLAGAREQSVLFHTNRQARNIEDALEKAFAQCAATPSGAGAALARPSPGAAASVPPPARPGGRAVHLQHIADTQEWLREVPPETLALGNTDAARPAWREDWPIRRFFQQELEEQSFYGFLSPGFREKTGLTPALAADFAQQCGPEVQVVTFGPQPDKGAFFLNIFEQEEAKNPGLGAACEAFFAAIGRPVVLKSLVMDSRQMVFGTTFVAVPAFWRAWLGLNEKLFSLCEGGDCALKQTLTADGGRLKVAVMQSMAAMLLTLDGTWTVRSGNSFACSPGRPGQPRFEAVACDALKIAFREQGFPSYMGLYATLRDQARQGVEPMRP